jgi:hypothetical protein
MGFATTLSVSRGRSVLCGKILRPVSVGGQRQTWP